MSNLRITKSNHDLRVRGWPACIAAVLVLVLGGCSAIKVKLGSRVYLEKIPATSMTVSLPRGPGIAPGEKSPLVVTIVQPDGKQLPTEGEGHGKILWQDLTVTPTLVTANNKGVLSLASDPRISDGLVAHVVVTAPSHPDLRAEMDIPVRYDRPFFARYAGSSGSSGMDGSNGMDGSRGSDGSNDPDHPVAGGNGGDGTNGSDGSDGGSGGDGPPVRVVVALRSSNHPLLEVSVSAQGRQSFFLVDPQGGSLSVSSEGGSGGSGGRGGRGGSGGSGGSGWPPGSSGHSGSDGRDGSRGSDGRGGSITVTYDPKAAAYLGAIRLSNPGGPRPVYRQEQMVALW